MYIAKRFKNSAVFVVLHVTSLSATSTTSKWLTGSRRTPVRGSSATAKPGRFASKNSPSIRYVPDRRVVVDGGVATTTGVTASMPIALTSVETSNNPHVMHYAPNLSNADVGGVTPGQHPYPFVILHGPSEYVVQHLGKAETAAITKEYEGMLARLCRINRLWCLPTSNSE